MPCLKLVSCVTLLLASQTLFAAPPLLEPPSARPVTRSARVPGAALTPAHTVAANAEVPTAAADAPPIAIGCRSIDDVSLACLDYLRARVQVLQNQLAIATLHAQITKQYQTQPTGGGLNPLADLNGTSDLGLPQVAEIHRLGHRVGATLQYTDGSEVSVTNGSRLADGAWVAHITDNHVMVRIGHQEVTLMPAPGETNRVNRNGNPFMPPFLPVGNASSGQPASVPQPPKAKGGN